MVVEQNNILSALKNMTVYDAEGFLARGFYTNFECVDPKLLTEKYAIDSYPHFFLGEYICHNHALTESELSIVRKICGNTWTQLASSIIFALFELKLVVDSSEDNDSMLHDAMFNDAGVAYCLGTQAVTA